MSSCTELYADVLIVGTGISGLYAALNLDDSVKVIIITKSKIKDSNSYLAQGGIVVAKDQNDISLHIEDTLKAGKYKNDLQAVKILSEESRINIDKLMKLGVCFDKTSDALDYTKEAAHTTNRILHVKDETGKAIIDTLYKKVLQKSNIAIYEDTCLLDIITSENTCYGGVALKDNTQLNIHSKVVILATGGIGGVFKNSTNKKHLTADSIGIAIKNNIILKDINYIQFHPTALYETSTQDSRFLISESLRGEGGKLLNIHGKRFIDELLPRDLVSDAILNEMKITESPYVYLTMSHLDSNYIKHRFPYIYLKCIEKGLDICKDPIPVSPAQHYFMGGIEVDLNSRSSMNNLYVVGESSCTGVHGSNRLASNSLLEGLVYSSRASKSISENIHNIPMINISFKKIVNPSKYSLKENSNLALNIFKRKVGRLQNELVDN